ncbi:SDR family NAD(P)-dependent oxidoreductase [Marinomonas mediterranea]|uniref:SDR family NAD(P)-dependent oxidoreductase n=1 Tax=Marinomonas mediterranea TaxID=119864 RepID=UPI00234B775D|nr:SDR family NAD(P)-dependent oxidoreductase [Marinomonas mediterranea]WCN09027.1 SDR family NAD(P)-dependent oxidoreductase [Marinomonas mediterranea]WCN13061.1 SDR family NAD(P)-dependent oxidoreductase [Marinomonas mediterranea]
MTNIKNQVLILGITGGIGSEVARQLLEQNWNVIALHRSPELVSKEINLKTKHITWIKGDAMNSEDVLRAAEGCCVIVHAVNPPGYKKWEKFVIPMIKNSINAAKKQRATVVFPGSIYNYGPDVLPNDVLPNISESTPQHPITKKGSLRAEMEQELKRFANDGGSVILIRAGDFYGPYAKNNWFSQGLINPNKAVKSIYNPSSKNVGHQWAYLPDVAQTMISMIKKRHELEPYAVYHMKGIWDPDGTLMVNTIQKIIHEKSGKKPKIAPFPWWLVWLAALFNTTAKELLEMKYLWAQPIKMENNKLRKKLGEEPHTPIEIAVEKTLRSLGALND